MRADIYYAYYPYESDSVLTAWLIRKFRDPQALFAGIEKGEHVRIDPKFQINTAQSRFRRSARFTAYESAKKILNIHDPCAEKLVKVSRILEAAPWRKQQYPTITTFERMLHEALPKTPDPSNLDKAFKVIDRFCEKDAK